MGISWSGVGSLWRNGINLLKNDLLKLTLINKKTKRVASSHHWWLALGAHAYSLADTQGIAGLLPHARGQKILQSNFLTLKTRRLGATGSSRNAARQQAYLILPRLEFIYRQNLRQHQKFLKRNFCVWLKNELNKPFSPAHKMATELGMDNIIETNHGVRWWMDRLKKMQS